MGGVCFGVFGFWKEKIIRALTAIFSVTIFVVMLLALLIAVIYIP